jgi:hypothetical protein
VREKKKTKKRKKNRRKKRKKKKKKRMRKKEEEEEEEEQCFVFLFCIIPLTYYTLNSDSKIQWFLTEARGCGWKLVSFPIRR